MGIFLSTVFFGGEGIISPLIITALQITAQFNDLKPQYAFIVFHNFCGSGEAWLSVGAVLRIQSLLKTYLGLKDLLPRCHTYMLGKLVLAGERPQFLCVWASPQGCFSALP